MKRICYIVLLGLTVFLFVGCKQKTNKPAEVKPINEKKELIYTELTDKELEVYGSDGDVKAQIELANRYDYGTADTGRNFIQAKTWYELAAMQGDKDALRCLGYIYLNGCLGEVDFDMAIDYFEQAIAAGDESANVGIARAYLDGYDEEIEDRDAKVMEYVQAAYQNDCPAGTYYMAYLLEEGIGTETDYAEAISLYNKVIEQKDLSIYDAYLVNASKTRLANMYVDAKGVEQDYETALSLFKESANEGYAMAQYYTGLMYENGFGVDRDYEEAMEWYLKAAEQEYAPALNQVGYMYYKGIGVDADIEQALYYQKLAAMQGYAAAQINLGYIYENGIGVEKDLETALEYYQLANEQGSDGAKEAIMRVQKLLNEEK